MDQYTSTASVKSAVANVVATFVTGSELYEQWRALKSKKKPAESELGASLESGPSTVNSQYAELARRHGNVFSRGDATCKAALVKVSLHLNQSLVNVLRRSMELGEVDSVEPEQLWNASEQAQKQAIGAMIDLSYRLRVAAPDPRPLQQRRGVHMPASSAERAVMHSERHKFAPVREAIPYAPQPVKMVAPLSIHVQPPFPNPWCQSFLSPHLTTSTPPQCCTTQGSPPVLRSPTFPNPSTSSRPPSPHNGNATLLPSQSSTLTPMNYSPDTASQPSSAESIRRLFHRRRDAPQPSPSLSLTPCIQTPDTSLSSPSSSKVPQISNASPQLPISPIFPMNNEKTTADLLREWKEDLNARNSQLFSGSPPLSNLMPSQHGMRHLSAPATPSFNDSMFQANREIFQPSRLPPSTSRPVLSMYNNNCENLRSSLRAQSDSYVQNLHP